MRELLPHVTHMLCIGWKARELTFLEMLQEELPRNNGIRAEFVTSSASTADDVRRRVGGPVSDFDVVGSPFDVDSGFSDLMAGERLGALLSSPVHVNEQSA